MFAEWLVYLLLAYFALGLFFAIPFIVWGVQQIDTQAKGAGWGFRCLIFPGATALWPLLLYRWRRGDTDPAVERNAHREAAG